VDIICAQGGEGGGHTGEVATSILIPKVVDLCRNAKSPLNGGPVYVVAAGGIFDGRGLAAALCFGAQAVWVGTRFVCATEAGAPPRHQQAIINADYDDTIRTIIYTGRPMRVLKTPYILSWENERQKEIKELTNKGSVPVTKELEERNIAGNPPSPQENVLKYRPVLMGQAAGAITEIKPAQQIINEMLVEAIAALRSTNLFVGQKASL